MSASAPARRSPRRAPRWAVAVPALASAAAFVAGCGAAAPRAAGGPAADPRAPATLYPLVEGRVWSYDVDTGDPTPTLAITRVVAVRGPRVEVSSGSAPVVYEVTADGIRHPGDGGWLLRAPVEPGAEWPARGGRTARVVEAGNTVEVPAGRFDDCVTVEERGGEADRRVRTTYCPGVGPVTVESEVRLEVAGGVERTRARLLGTNVEGDLDGGVEVLARPGEDD